MNKTHKLLSMVMAMVLLSAMSVCMPAMAEGTPYAEGSTFEMEGLSYTVVAGSVTVTDEVAFEGDTNTTDKIKITHTEDSVTTVKVELSTAGIEDVGKLEIATDFVITSLTSGTGLTVTKIQTNGGREVSTEAFTRVTDFWRTAMLQNPVITSIVITASFSGMGTVYLDNASVTPCTGIFNGDFKGISGEFTPTGWSSGNLITTQTDYDNTSKAGIRLHQTKEGNYITNTGLGRSKSISQNIDADCVVSGALYRVTINTKGDYFGFNASSGSTVLPHGDTKYASWTASTPDWSDKSMVFKANNLPTGGVFAIYITCQQQSAGTVIGYLRNVRFEKVLESSTVINGEGENAETISAGAYTVSYSYPLSDIAAITYSADADYTNDIKTTASTVNDATSTTKLRALVAVYEESENGKSLYEIKLSDEIASKVSLPGLSSTETDIGIIPATADPISVEIPDNGKKYSIKVMSWSSLSGLAPHSSGFDFPAAE